MKRIIIRRCKNLRLVDRLRRQIFVPSDLEDDLPENVWFVAWCEGKAVGFGGLKFYSNGAAFLSLAGVLPEYRGRGIQKRLIDVRTKHSRSKGWGRCITYTVVDNPPSMNSLIKAGFKPYTPAYNWVGAKVVFWQKVLKKGA